MDGTARARRAAGGDCKAARTPHVTLLFCRRCYRCCRCRFSCPLPRAARRRGGGGGGGGVCAIICPSIDCEYCKYRALCLHRLIGAVVIAFCAFFVRVLRRVRRCCCCSFLSAFRRPPSSPRWSLSSLVAVAVVVVVVVPRLLPPHAFELECSNTKHHPSIHRRLLCLSSGIDFASQ
ncbi:uncharacterized protein J3D65DRAFT_292906 [Phyllosticta citribraziliensis]|uniref:Uncharacterized protein n=1 Tax=Phyllosticta citribraziliensis TaxID=989973 RepID=A0ABR1LYN9_9PEZI